MNFEFFMLAFMIGLVTLLILCSLFFYLGCSPETCKSYPQNMILLGIFTLSESYLASSICGYYTPESVFQAAVLTTAATCGLTWYAWTTKNDFTKFAHFFYGSFLII